jgi:hypothetical protein
MICARFRSAAHSAPNISPVQARASTPEQPFGGGLFDERLRLDESRALSFVSPILVLSPEAFIIRCRSK